jgi:hypothetical protein
MPLIQYQNCSIDGDLAQAVLDMEQQVGDITSELLTSIAAIPIDLTLIPQGNALLDLEVVNAPNANDAATIATEIGIPQAEPTQQDDEERLELLGLIMIKGILYLADNSGNINAYRRLFFALGANIHQFISIVSSGAPYVVTQTYLNVQQLPTKPSWTLSEVQALYSNPAIEAVYTGGDGASYVVIPTFLGINQGADQVSASSGVPQNQILTQVFWFNQVTQTQQILTELARLGFTGDNLSAALFGERLLTLNPNEAEDSATNAALAVAQAQSQLGLLVSRFATTDAGSIESLRQEAYSSVQTALSNWYLNQLAVREWSTLLIRPQDISDFLSKNTQSDLVYLLTKRLGVSGINFQATQVQIISKMTQTLSINAGSSTVSSLVVNSVDPKVDPQIDQSNKNLINSYSASLQLQNSPIKIAQVTQAQNCLGQPFVTEPDSTASNIPLVGYASFDSPSSILTRNLDFDATFNTDAILAAVSAAATPFPGAITFVVAALTSLLTTIRNAANAVFAALEKQVTTLVAQIEGFLSKFSSFHATPSLNSSVLKCALNLNLAASFPILDELAPFLDLLRRQLQNVLAQINKAIFNLINKLLCMPLNLINSFLGGVQNALPSFCQVNKLTLPPAVEAALLNFNNVCQIQSTTVQAFAKNAIRLSGSIQATPLKLSQFRNSVLCENNSSDNFFKASASQITAGIGTNPLAGAASVL